MRSCPTALAFLALFTANGLLAHRAEAKCESLLQSIDSLAGDQLVSQYKRVITCDTKVANQVFHQFMRAAEDADALVALSLTAIDADIWNPVWDMVGKISSYEARDEVADRVGMACSSHEKVVGFLQGAYYGLRDIEFSQWDDALISCNSPALDEWLIRQIEDPPPKLYDEKWSALADAVVTRMGAGSLTPLANGGIVAAGNGGPFEAILMKMESAVAPDLGQEMSAENRTLLEEALVGMARQLTPEQARSVADRLANSGSDDRAAELLATVYPGFAKGGVYTYGGASVEAGSCEGSKQAVIHYASLMEPGKRWLIFTASESTLRAFKPKLTKCEVNEPWPIATSPGPLHNSSEVDAWVQDLVKTWTDKGYEVKLRAEKATTLP